MKKYFIFIVVLTFMIVTLITNLFSKFGTAWRPVIGPQKRIHFESERGTVFGGQVTLGVCPL
jgi:hypothetical protein